MYFGQWLPKLYYFRLADDGNTVTLLMKDGTRHNTLIFLEDGRYLVYNMTQT